VLYVALAYLVATVCYGILGVFVRGRRAAFAGPDARLQVAAWGSAICTVAIAFLALHERLTFATLTLIDLVHAGLWLGVLSGVARVQSQPRWLVASLSWAGPAALVVGGLLVLLVPEGATIAGMSLSRALAVIGLTLALLGVLGFEQAFRNSVRAGLTLARWIFLSFAVLFVANLFWYGAALLLRAFDTNAWALRGFLLGFIALPIAIATRRMADWAVGLTVSRQVVFYTTSFLLVGVYLVLMSLGGVFLRESGLQWSAMAQNVFLAIAGLILLLVVFSGDIRRKLRVLVVKHFFKNKYDYRLEWLRFIHTLSERDPSETVQQNAIRSVAQIIRSQHGLLWAQTGAGRFAPFASWPHVDENVSHLPSFDANDEVVAFMLRTKWVVDLTELARRPDLYDRMQVHVELRALADGGLIVPLFHGEELYGFLLLARVEAQGELTFEDRDLLKTVGRHLAVHLWQADMDRSLAESRQFETFNRFAAFVMHDLKNSIAQLRLVVQNAERHKRNPQFVDDAMAAIAHTVDRMGRLLAQLSQDAAAGSPRTVDLALVAERAALRAGERAPVPRVVVSERPSVLADPERLATVLEHILRNAQDATPEDGNVEIIVGMRGGAPQLTVSDTGGGMDAEFIRERLFRPFDTTKGARGMGIGAYQAREYLRSVGGDVEVTSTPGRGTAFSFIFPATQTAASVEDEVTHVAE
jgi:putative PEP-CTERM system histidine kinase